jgi:L-rhamnose mutarotase
MSCNEKQRQVMRYGMVIGIKPEKIDYYTRLHAATWPGVLAMIRECNIENYSIYLKELSPGSFYLFSYFEYVGDNYNDDMAKMAADPLTREWWGETMPCQIPLEGEKSWALMEEVFHND